MDMVPVTFAHTDSRQLTSAVDPAVGDLCGCLLLLYQEVTSKSRARFIEQLTVDSIGV